MSIPSNTAIIKYGNLTRGFATFARKAFDPISVKSSVHDGDTIKIQLLGNFSIRFLGIDTPEMTFQYPIIGSNDDDKWLNVERFDTYLEDPFSSAYPDSTAFKNSLESGLVTHLQNFLGPNCAVEHRRLAEEAEDALENMIINEYVERAQAGKHFSFFMAFSNEILDGYGRLLCYINRNNTKTEQKQNRYKYSYNERMLEIGMAFPYFIWPNVTPFFMPGTPIKDSIPYADDFQTFMENNAARLNKARNYVASSRANKLGVWSEKIIAPHELRYLARRKPPNRWVLNLETCSPQLIEPTKYYTIQNPEDRLYIDEHYIPLFQQKGYIT
jgi:endonuclease YncB( thermonuclease family)